MKRRILSLSLVAIVAGAAPLQADAPVIDHHAVACIVAGKFPKLRACFSSEIARAKTFFHAEGVHDWYYVEMGPDQREAVPPAGEAAKPLAASSAGEACYTGILPRASRKLIRRRIEYYIEVVNPRNETGRTDEHQPIVVRRALDCEKKGPVAPISPTGPTAVFPSLPAGFTISTFPTAAVVGATTVAAGVAVAVAASNGGSTPTPTQTPAPAPVPSTAPTPGTPETPPPTTPLGLSCAADPRSGPAPLTVAFTASPSGGTGSYDFDWSFGDGGTAHGPHPTHTYTSAGNFDAVVRVTSGTQVRQCDRTIGVGSAPPTSFSLRVSLAGSGTGTVTDDHGKINCGPTCSATYVSGTQVALTPAAASGSAFGAWSGDCSGAGSCVVNIDGPKAVTARFDIAPSPTPTPTPTPSPKISPMATLTFKAIATFGRFEETVSGNVNFQPSDNDCSVNTPATPTTCTEVHPVPTTVTLTADASAFCECTLFVCWGGACAGTDTANGSVCTLVLDSDKSASATFQDSPCVVGSSRPGLLWLSQLDVAGAMGQITVNGGTEFAAGGRSLHALTMPAADNRFEAMLVQAEGKPGSWRFDLQDPDAIVPGSLKVLRGDVELITPASVVFRLKGEVGEQVAFSFHLRR